MQSRFVLISTLGKVGCTSGSKVFDLAATIIPSPKIVRGGSAEGGPSGSRWVAD